MRKFYCLFAALFMSLAGIQVNAQTTTPDSCSAGFVSTASSATSLGEYFVAQPFDRHNKRVLRVCWTFGDTHDTCISYNANSTGQFAVYHLYAHPDNYNVCVDILYDGGCESQSCHRVAVGVIPDSCRADFERVAQGPTSSPLTAMFRALPWQNHNKKPLHICWTFGDGRGDTCLNYNSAYTGQYTIIHNYLHGGNYQVCVDIVYDGGCESRNCKPVVISNSDSCSANFQAISTNSASLGKYFVAIPWNNNNKKPLQVCWHFGDAHDTCIQYTTSYTGQYAVFHTYAHADNYNVCVDILYDGGCSSHYCRITEVGERPDSCSASFQVLASTANTLSKYFVAQPWNNHNKKPLQVCWHFGDAHDTCIQYTTSYTGQYAVFHTYGHADNYNVCVDILYDGGCSSHYCHIVEVHARPDTCGANYERIVSPTAAPLRAYFRALPTHNNNKKPQRICWTFGDATPDTCITYPAGYTGEYVVAHNYQHRGTYQVCVYILYDGGCEAHACKTQVIQGNEHPYIQLSPNPVMTITHVMFFSLYTEQITVRILNLNGLVVRSYTRNVVAGPNTWELDLSSLMPGIYSFLVQSPNQSASTLLIKL